MRSSSTIRTLFLISTLVLAAAPIVTADTADTTPPIIDAHPHVTVNATSADGAIVAYGTPLARDAVDGNFSASCAPLNLTLFPIGVTEVLCDATDAAGNVANQTKFNVTVRDAAPVMSAVSDISIIVPDQYGTIVSFALPTWTDAVDGTSGEATCNRVSGSHFGVGATTVTCSAMDTKNQTTNKTFVIRVTLNVVPTIAMTQSSYGTVAALTTGNVQGSYHAKSSFGNDLVDLSIKVRWIRVVPGAGYVQGDEVTGVTDAEGNFAFAPTTAFLVPGNYVVVATVTQANVVSVTSTNYQITAN